MDHSLNGCSPEQREALNSPIPSIRTPFTKDRQIDFDGVRSQVDFVIAGGAKTIMLTWGDSLHSVMTDDEIAHLAKVVVKHTRGRAKVIAADNIWATKKAVAYGKYCAEIGADFLMLLPPDWAGQTTKDSIVSHFRAVSEHIPTMLVTAFFAQTGVFGPRSSAFNMEVIHALYDQVSGLVAVKDDVLGDFGMNLCTTVHDRWAVVSGGGFKNHTLQIPYGVDGYLSLFMSFKPGIDWYYWKAIQTNDYGTSWKAIREIELPMKKYFFSVSGGFNPVVHGILELFGICKRYLPLPYHTLSDQQMEELADFLGQISHLWNEPSQQ